MERPIFIAVIGYIIGIIVGLYFNFSIAFFYILLFSIYFLYKYFLKSNKREKFKLISIKRYKRYLKLYFHKSSIFLVLIISVISNTIVLYQNRRYKSMVDKLNEKENISIIATIISEKEEKEYSNKYIVEAKVDNLKVRLYITVARNINLEYGDKISLVGDYIKPEFQRNYGGFDYYNYLKQLKIYGTIKCSSINIIEKKQGHIIFRLSNKISIEIKDRINKIMKEDIASIVNGLILGDKSKIEEEVNERFSNAGISHILAVSGMHVTYIILGISISLRKMIGKRKSDIFTIFIVIFYMFITNFSPSIVRAGIMSILYIFSNIIHRKNDILTSISFSLLIILIYNPFLIMNLGLQLTYGGTIGIILFNKTILDILNNIKFKNKKYKYIIPLKYKKILNKIKEIISISISVQIFIFPIIIFHLNKFSTYFIISNLLLAIIVGPAIILCFLFIIIILVNMQVAKFIGFIIEYLIQILLFFSKVGNFPLSKIYIPTLKIYQIIIYYIMIFIFKFLYDIYNSKNINKTKIRVKNLIALYKFRIKQKKLKSGKFFILICILIIILYKFPQKLKIHFVDVGQGDCTFIVTPNNKTILIDGGGSVNSSFDVGKNTLLPYILDRGFSKIDFVIISHFDQDHVRWVDYYLRRVKSKTSNYRETV